MSGGVHRVTPQQGAAVVDGLLTLTLTVTVTLNVDIDVDVG
jgi:hypothetical protein